MRQDQGQQTQVEQLADAAGRAIAADLPFTLERALYGHVRLDVWFGLRCGKGPEAEGTQKVVDALTGDVLWDDLCDACAEEVHNTLSRGKWPSLPPGLRTKQEWYALADWTMDNLEQKIAYSFEHREWQKHRLADAARKAELEAEAKERAETLTGAQAGLEGAGEAIHIRRFDVADVEDRWRRGNLAGYLCTACKSPKVAIRIRVLMPLDDFKARAEKHPAFLQIVQLMFEGQVPTVETIHGPHVPVSEVFACDHCKKEAEHVAAKDIPSWNIVQIDRAPRHAKVVQTYGKRSRSRS